MSRGIGFAEGEFYHLYNHGTEKRNIYVNDSDRKRFLMLLYLCNSSLPVDLKLQGRTLEEVVQNERGTPLVKIGAYCLMPNHFHLLICAGKEGGVSRFMQKLMTAYTMYFNKKYEHSGVLFQGKFKAIHVSDDRYLKYLIAYIHLNPIKLIDPQWKENGIRNRQKAKQFLKNYRYSSFLDFWREEHRLERLILATDSLPKYFDSGTDFKRSVTEWLNYSPG